MTTLRDWLLAILIVAAMSLSVGCGSEAPEARPAEPRPIDGVRPPVPEVVEAITHVCAVTLHDDGTVTCNCQPK